MKQPILATSALLALATSPLLAQDAQQAHHHHGSHSAALQQPGQAAFGALSEVVALLQADPKTDWSKVDITRLRNHLVDMDEVVMNANTELEERDSEVRVIYSGAGRTLEAIRRMIPAHAKMMNGHRDWKSEIETREDGLVWILSTQSIEERTRIRALGPFGLLTLGFHHGPHHLAMAKGMAMPNGSEAH